MRDFIVNMIEAEISTFNLMNLSHRDLDITITKAEGAPKLYDSRHTHIGWTRYKFADWISDPVKLEIDIDHQHKIWVYKKPFWIRLTQFLMHQVTTYGNQLNRFDDWRLARQTELWDKQWRYWLWVEKTQNKRFRLLELPAELRIKIYDFALGERQGPVLGYDKCCLAFKERQGPILGNNTYRLARLGGPDVWDLYGRVIPQFYETILQLNHQTHDEGTDVYFQTAVFRAVGTTQLRKLVKHKMLSERVKRLEISLSHQEYGNVFGPPSQRIYNPQLDDVAKLVRELKLDHLTIELQPPSGYTILVRTRIYVPCQYKLVERVFKNILPWIAGNEVTIQGFAKVQQKKDFEKKCADIRTEYLQWCKTLPAGCKYATVAEYAEWNAEEDGGVRLGASEVAIEDPIQEYDEQPALEPAEVTARALEFDYPECLCNVSCSLKTWTPDS